MRLLLLATVFALVPAAAQSPTVSTPESREAVSLTVYNGGFAVVREVRPLVLRRGVQALRFEGVPAQIDPTSLSLVSLTAPGSLSVLEQNYQYNLIGTNSVLDAAVGQRVRLVRQVGERTIVEEGVLISQPGQGRIIELDDGRVLVNPEGTIELLTRPEGLLSRPSLLWRLATERAGEHRVEARYLTNGMTWKADYVAVVNEAETRVDVTGWVTLQNNSGASYPEAALQLIAGDVRRVSPNRPQPMYDQAVAEVAMARAAPAPPQQEAFFEYHLYTFPEPTTIEERETKQLELLSAADVGVGRRLIFDGTGQYFPFYRPRRPGAVGDEMSAAVVLELENAETNNMGMPLPAGIVRVYKADSRGNLQFLGEDSIDHTPRNETVRLYVGDAFDVVGTRREIENRRINDYTREITVEVEVRNRKETATTVDVVERVFWGEWTITDSTHEHERLDARTAQFTVTLGPDETETVRYTARLRS
ncbi:DUF4139 domain-containing protein [Rubrivirga marina]|uniref:DUF4139 domain-containing protein n=1 Tax=Rubrivirga marina TaxID=1196024 RepID=A0A271J3Q4_9BACT|nr:DUF4139 domain-containing protein [Rubrivirga marina]PAP77585.1 hypothetical protein BSZ37_14605 [Rubrivirga marina]